MSALITIAALLFSIHGFAGTLLCLPESRVELRGDSTLRKYSAVANQMSLTGTTEPKPAAGSLLTWTPTEVIMLLDVKNLKSGSDGLDEHMQENLKATAFPQIQLKLTSFNFLSEKSVTAAGTLMVAGVRKPVEITASVLVENAVTRIKGIKTVLMSDFGIAPPAMMLGALKTRDEIEIIFDVVCQPESGKKEKL